MAASSSRKMVVLRAFSQTQCITAIQDEAMVLAARTIYEIASKPTDTITDFNTAVGAIADLLPTTTAFADHLPQEYTNIIKECVMFMTPRNAGESGRTVGPGGTTITVESMTEKELRDKYVIVGGIRLWKAAEAPYNIFYCHLWIQRSFMEWKATWESFVGNTTLPDSMAHRQSCTERLIETWFDLTKGVTRHEDITPAHAKLFQTAVELLAEGFLVRRGVNLTGNVSTATAALAQALQKRKHDQRPLDYYSDIVEARQARDAVQKNGSR